VRTLADSPHLDLEGIFTHFASSEVFTNEDTEAQRVVFETVLERLRTQGVTAPLIHLANSAAVVLRPSTWGTMVRPGLVLYGYHQCYEPEALSGEADAKLPLRPALALRARLISLRNVAPGQGVGYNHRWVASRPSRIAVISAGYADGIPRALTNRGRVIIHGKFAPLVGTVSMDLITVDVTDMPEVRFGDIATIYGADGDTTQYVSDVAQQVGTVASDLCCALGKRVPRFYLP
jgi:alanine racemase